MHLRRRSIRARTFFLVLVPLLALLGLYAFATILTARDPVTLARATVVRDSIADPIGFYATEVQGERTLATVYLAAPTAQDLVALTTQEAKSDAALAVLRKAVASAATRRASSPVVKAALAATLRDAARLPALRASIIADSVSRAAAQRQYNGMIAVGYHSIVEAILQMPSVPLVNQALAVMRVAEAEDILLQSEALLVGDDTAGHFPAADHAEFARLIGQYQGMLNEAMPDLDPAYRASFRSAVSPKAAAALHAAEDTVINSPAGAVPKVPLAAYAQAAQAVAGGLAAAGFEAGGTLASAMHQAAGPIDLRLILAGGFGLLAIIVSIIVSVWTGRGLVRQLAELRQGALELANTRLPRLMAELSAGEEVDIEAEAPPLAAGPDEIGQVRQAFNSVQRSAIEAAVGQAQLRAAVTTAFRNLARRSQSLLHQQLSLLDALERGATEPAELEGLFKIDHLTTRMRRHAEGLVVIADDEPGRSWTEPVPLADVLRGAVAEVADYTRLRVVCTSRAALEGRAVADVIHLVAELAENATIFSPPDAPVRILGRQVVRGFAVEIEDCGPGMPEEMLAGFNAGLLDPPPLNLAESEQLGLYVAARLAHRHGMRITLRSSPFGGITAIVLIPPYLIAADGTADRASALITANTGRHVSRASGVGPCSAGALPGPAAAMNGNGAGHGNGRGNGDRSGAGTLAAPISGPCELPEWMIQHGAGMPEGTDGTTGARSPDETRDSLTAMQRGWERGRGEDTGTGQAGAAAGHDQPAEDPPADSGDSAGPGT
jgi:signal transduction histidine kinase